MSSEIYLRKYGEAATIDGITLITRGAQDHQANPTLAAGDVKISKDGGALNDLTSLPAVTPAAGTSVQAALSATEMQAKRISMEFIDQTGPKEWEDKKIIIETYGHASAQHPFDLGTASTPQTGDSFARLGAPTGANIATDIADVEGKVDDLEIRLTADRATKLDQIPTYLTGTVVTDVANGASQFKTDLAATANDTHKDKLLLFTSGALSGQVRRITTYNGTTKFVTVASPFTGTPANGDAYKLVNE